MAAVVVDTHTVLWYLSGDPRLSQPALAAMRAATAGGDPIIVPSMCLAEATYLVEKSRIPIADLDSLRLAVSEPASGLRIAPFDLAVAVVLRQIGRDLVPDLPDRIIAATALKLGLPLITRDARIQSAGIQTIW